MAVNYTLTPGPDGGVMLHRIDCPEVERLRMRGEPIMTMLDCRHEPGDDIPRHDCLTPKPHAT